MACEDIRVATADKLRDFMQREIADVQSGIRSTSINCPPEDIDNLAESLGLAAVELPEGWQELCPAE